MKKACVLFYFLSIQFAFSQVFKKGEIVDTVVCDQSPSQSYTLYLPLNYSEEQSWPIIYIFDPAARGVYATGIFKLAAEQLGYIIVCSNNSRNGNWSVVFEAARAMKKDTELKFSIDKNRVYTAGFSGGSRAAMVMAKSVYNAIGIIANAGAYPTKNQYLISAKDSIAYAAIIGNLDMNYLEHLKLSEELNAQQCKNILIVSDQPHQWARSHEVFTALQWMEIVTNPSLSSNQEQTIINKLVDWGDSIIASNEAIYNLPQLALLESNLKIEFSTSPLKLIASKTVQKELRLQRKVEQKEQKQLSSYISTLSSLHQTKFNAKIDSVHTKNWWKSEIDKLRKKEKSNNKVVSRSAQRLSNYIWASFAETSFEYEAKNDYIFAQQLNDLWIYAQPKSVWAVYNSAKLYSMMGEEEKAIEALYKAHELGMIRRASLTKQAAFSNLSEKEKFKQLIVLLKE